MISAINRVSFTGTPANNDNSDKVRLSEVGVVGGATVGGAKYGISSLKRFNNKAFMMSEKTVKAVKEGAKASSQIKSLWAKMFANAKEYKDFILNWAKKTATGKFAQKVVQSAPFKATAKAMGGIGALFVFISGLGEMGTMFSRISNK